jgi:hypothetical protein
MSHAVSYFNFCSSKLARWHIIFLLLVIPSISQSQIYNVSYNQISFGGTGAITPKVGTGTSVNNIVLYENVVTVFGQQIDAIVTTQELSSGTTITTYDYTGTTNATNNVPAFFSPQFNFGSGGGYGVFKIQFILGGSYSNSTNTGTNVTLQNVILNTYDLDGNGNSGSNQYAEFGGFSSYELGNPTNLSLTYNSALGLTKFRTSINTNTADVTDPKNRVRVSYGYLSEFVAKLGSGGSGAGYFFLDFSTGSTFTTSVSYAAPVLDLNTTTSGLDNSSVIVAPNTAMFDFGGANITYSGSSLDNLKISFSTSQIQDGAFEELKFYGASSGGPIPLNFTNGQVFSNIQIGSVSYAVTASVTGGTSTLTFVKSNGSSMTLAEDEALLDAFQYSNSSSSATVATRVFVVTTLAGVYETAPAKFYLTITSSLPTTLISLQGNCAGDAVTIEWQTASEHSSDHFMVQRLTEDAEWLDIDRLEARGESTEIATYTSVSERLNSELLYRIVQYDQNGEFSVFGPIQITCEQKEEAPVIYPNPSDGHFTVAINRDKGTQSGTVTMMSISGLVFAVNEIVVENGTNTFPFDFQGLTPGVYMVKTELGQTSNMQQLVIQ